MAQKTVKTKGVEAKYEGKIKEETKEVILSEAEVACKNKMKLMAEEILLEVIKEVHDTIEAKFKIRDYVDYYVSLSDPEHFQGLILQSEQFLCMHKYTALLKEPLKEDETMRSRDIRYIIDRAVHYGSLDLMRLLSKDYNKGNNKFPELVDLGIGAEKEECAVCSE